MLGTEHRRALHPAEKGLPCPLDDLELHRPECLALDDGGALFDATRDHDVGDFEPDEVAPSQFAIDGHIEEREIADVAGELQAHSDRPDVLRQERPLLADDPALVPGHAWRAEHRQV